jgi:Site-specific recombinase XerD
MIQTLTVPEEAQLLHTLLLALRAAQGVRRGKTLRDLVLLLLGLRCGFRAGECQKLRVSDVWANDAPLTSIHVPTNFNKYNIEGWVHVSNDLTRALLDYVPLRREWAPEEDPDPILLPPRPGQLAKRTSLTRTDISDIVHLWADRAGIRGFKFHSLRHTFATRILQRGGGNIKTVQMLLRHRAISSTSIYLHPNQDELDLAVRRAFNDPPEGGPQFPQA